MKEKFKETLTMINEIERLRLETKNLLLKVLGAIAPFYKLEEYIRVQVPNTDFEIDSEGELWFKGNRKTTFSSEELFKLAQNLPLAIKELSEIAVKEAEKEYDRLITAKLQLSQILKMLEG